MLDPESEILWLRRVRDLSHLLAAERDVRKLLPMILDAAIELTEAERGFLVLVQGRKPDGGYRFKVEVARGFDKATLTGSSGQVSRTVVKRVLESEREGLVTTDEADKDLLEVSSVQARRVLSIAGVPLRLRGQIKGVLYLDHRFTQGAFTQAHLAIMRTFADQCALALETAEIRAGIPKSGESEELAAPLPPAPGERTRCGNLIGGSPAMLELYAQIERAARTWDPVLILGEPGTGKELVAREIHEQGSFPEEPFQVVSAGPDLAANLLGTPERAGALLRAGRGTVLLDEVSRADPETQATLATILQSKSLTPPGTGRPQPVQCRVLASSGVDLRQLASEGRFRPELYYRLDVLRITVPGLRERPRDVPLLFDHFLQFTGRRIRLSDRAQRLLVSYAWPGNVRELENEVRRLAALGQPQISAAQLSEEIREGRGVSRATGDLAGKTLADVERHMVEAAMRECKGNKSRAARQLGVPRTTLYHLLERYGIQE
ncbi:MAG: sigma-54-dependent Fis family transcriptional regulator [Planctomycetota bacterium]